MSAEAEPQGSDILDDLSDLDRDSLHIMPLRIVPLRLPGLARARLIKSAQLNSELELFHDNSTGAGLIQIKALPDFIGADEEDLKADMAVLYELAELNSFDVFSLRNSLRDLKIDVRHTTDLTLSPGMEARLTEYMKAFTRPLVVNVFGASTDNVSNSGQIIEMFTNVDRKVALKNMQKIAAMMNITVADIPDFLEKYGDIYLSLSYFRRCLDEIVPKFDQLTDWMDEMRGTMLRENQPLMDKCEVVRSGLNELLGSVTGRFESFDRNSQTFWDNISMESFQKLHALITSHHETIGGVLCGLTVKLDAWESKFPHHTGSPHKRAEFVQSDLAPGLEKLLKLEHSAPSTIM
ncbi:hypothetical protein T8K17_23905 [Thalassobaculum sp. OXR-137]|uniref:hypothetical protein n=1 Tax=Thalassobaculum sp. OXR-137 TaxID=3100173 RepID=UPI002AC8C6E1|nr:hypothetical protein [Thalassobaculum sp. OXR-137]WPZ34263.1 hypothetical protein T8K17_23905 [Thalassobaculum sp. OXR-137]